MKRNLLLSVATLGATAVASPVLAQEEEEIDELKLEKIIVTATKREQVITDIPQSITALTGDTIEQFGNAGDDIQYLSGRVPSLVIESSFGRIFPRPYIRGLGNTDFDLNASQPVSFIYDEVVFENPVLKGFPVFDVERVEVLRGPQGTLFGRNTPAGAIKFESVKPGEDLNAYAKVSFGSFETRQFEGAVGGALSDTLSVRLSGQYQERDDFIENQVLGSAGDAGGFEDFAFRGQVLYEPSEDLSWLVNVHGRTLDGGQTSFQANAFETGSSGARPGFDREISFADAGADSVLDNESFGITSRAEYDFGSVTGTYILGFETVDVFSRGDVDGGFGAVFAPPSGPGAPLPFAAESADGITDHSQITHELRFSNSEDGFLNWTVGLYVFDEELDILSLNFNTLGGGVEDGRAIQTQETTAVALFGNVSYLVTDNLTLAGGLRFSDEEKDFVAERLTAPFGGPPLGPIALSVGDEAISWDLSVTYALNVDTNIFARASRGFRAPAIQGRILFGDAVTTADSEQLTSLEVGVKSVLLDGRALFNATAYTYEVDDQQLTAIGGAGNFNQLLNADKGIGRGVEADLNVKVTEGLTFSSSVSYNYTSIRDDSLQVGTCGSPCTVLDPLVGSNALVDGNPFPQAPEWIANFALDYTKPLGEGELFATTDWSFRSEANIFLYESIEFETPARWEGGAAVGYRQGPWYGKVFARNITDEVGVVSAIDFNNLSGIFNQPRFIGLELGWSY